MDLKQFWDNVKDNGVDYDGVYGKQCVDLINAYCDRVLGIKGACYGVRYAYEIFSNIGATKFKNWKRLAYKSGVTADYGDIIVWKKERNGYAGHIAIVKSSTKDNVTVYEQNYDGKGGRREHTYDYTNVYGFIKIPKELKAKIGSLDNICKLVKANAVITKSTPVYHDNCMQKQTGYINKGEKVRCAIMGSKWSVIQYSASKDKYCVGLVPTLCVK